MNAVLAYSEIRDRDELRRKVRELKSKHSAVVYTGTLPDNVVVVL